jgi:phage shock protein PspC (stress-responsive transcriptional regulator)
MYSCVFGLPSGACNRLNDPRKSLCLTGKSAKGYFMNQERSLNNLKKSKTDKKIAGVCGGLGEYTAIPSWIWRVIFVLSVFIGGLGALTYIVLWLCMPSADAFTPPDSKLD